jgi:hypothetical protein
VDVFVAPVLAGGATAHSPAGGLGCQRIAQTLRLDRLEANIIDGDLRLQGTIAPAGAPTERP